MVKIKKGKLTFEVTYDIFKTHYEPNGWRIISDNNKKSERDENSSEIIENKTSPEGTNLMSMNMSELREYAAMNGIDISEASTKKEIRAIIESAIDI